MGVTFSCTTSVQGLPVNFHWLKLKFSPLGVCKDILTKCIRTFKHVTCLNENSLSRQTMVAMGNKMM